MACSSHMNSGSTGRNLMKVHRNASAVGGDHVGDC